MFVCAVIDCDFFAQNDVGRFYEFLAIARQRIINFCTH